MRYKSVLSFLLAGLICAGVSYAADGTASYRKGLALYERGMYGRARVLFEQAGDPLSQAYALLCSAKDGSPDYQDRMIEYLDKYPSCILAPQLHFCNALVLFGQGHYLQAAKELDSVDEKIVGENLLPEMKFKRGFCHYSLEEYDDASACFSEVLKMPFSEYTAPSQYFLGYTEYVRKSFGKAAVWFEKASADSRFAEMSEFYLVECNFMEKNYKYVVNQGEKLIADAPDERKARLARLLSESYMVLGNKTKALEYLKMESPSEEPRTRADYFHAGSVLYSVSDWQGAVRNFSAMADRTDSLGQVANYQLGYSYVRTGNKVAALDAFNEAAKYGYDCSVQEDAAFNYAKLAFDLNHDDTGFKAYLRKYSTAAKGEQIYSYMAIASLFNRDYKAAIEAFDNIDVLDDTQKGNYIKANYLRANQLMESGAWSDAVPYLRAAGFYYPHTDVFNQMSRYWLAEACFRSGNIAEALKIFSDLYNTSALDGKPEGRLLSYNVAYCYYNQNNMASAARWFDTYIASNSKMARRDAMVRRADCDFLRRNYKDAIDSYSKVMMEFDDVNDVYPYYRQGLAYGLSGDRKQKASTLRRVMKADPSAEWWNEAMYEYGRSCMDVSDGKSAAEAFTQLRVKSADSTYVARALIGLGMVYRNNADYDRALDSYKGVISMMPGSEYAQDALLAIESIYQTKKQPEMYLAYLEAQKLNVNKTPEERELMYFNTAEQVFLAENWNNAAKLLENYLSNYPEGKRRGEATFYLAESYKALGRKEDACIEYAKVPGLIPESSFSETARFNCASINYSLERYQAAYDAYAGLEGAARMESNREAAKLGMMRSAFRAKNYEAAILACGAVQGVESDYVKAKSLMALSRRSEAMDIFRTLSANPSAAEGAEAAFVLAQDALDRADYESVEKVVHDFAQKGASQSYWLARAFLVLGDSFAARGNDAQAKATYESIRDGYSPAGEDDDVQDNVKLRLERLQTKN